MPLFDVRLRAGWDRCKHGLLQSYIKGHRRLVPLLGSHSTTGKVSDAGLFLVFKEPHKRFMTTIRSVGDKLKQGSPGSNKGVSLVSKVFKS